MIIIVTTYEHVKNAHPLPVRLLRAGMEGMISYEKHSNDPESWLWYYSACEPEDASMLFVPVGETPEKEEELLQNAVSLFLKNVKTTLHVGSQHDLVTTPAIHEAFIILWRLLRSVPSFSTWVGCKTMKEAIQKLEEHPEGIRDTKEFRAFRDAFACDFFYPPLSLRAATGVIT